MTHLGLSKGLSVDVSDDGSVYVDGEYIGHEDTIARKVTRVSELAEMVGR